MREELFNENGSINLAALCRRLRACDGGLMRLAEAKGNTFENVVRNSTDFSRPWRDGSGPGFDDVNWLCQCAGVWAWRLARTRLAIAYLQVQIVVGIVDRHGYLFTEEERIALLNAAQRYEAQLDGRAL